MAATTFEQQIDAIAAQVNDESILFDFMSGPGQLTCSNPETDRIRRVLFQPGRADDVVAPEATGTVQTETGLHVDTLLAMWINVDCHIITESFNTTWLLLNNVVYASELTLRGNSQFSGAEFFSDPDDPTSADFASSRYCVLGFRWKLHLFKGITPLPPCGEPVEDYVTTGDMGTMTAFGHTVDLNPDD